MLGTATVFADLDAEALAAIAAVATSVTLDAGDALVRQGELGDALYVVLTGALARRPARARRRCDNNSPRTARPRGLRRRAGVPDQATPGGDGGCPRARERAAHQQADALDAVLGDYPAARRQLVDFAMRRLPSLRLASTGLFVGVEPAALERFDSESNWVRIRGKQTLLLGKAPSPTQCMSSSMAASRSCSSAPTVGRASST